MKDLIEDYYKITHRTRCIIFRLSIAITVIAVAEVIIWIWPRLFSYIKGSYRIAMGVMIGVISGLIIILLCIVYSNKLKEAKAPEEYYKLVLLNKYNMLFDNKNQYKLIDYLRHQNSWIIFIQKLIINITPLLIATLAAVLALGASDKVDMSIVYWCLNMIGALTIIEIIGITFIEIYKRATVESIMLKDVEELFVFNTKPIKIYEVDVNGLTFDNTLKVNNMSISDEEINAVLKDKIQPDTGSSLAYYEYLNDQKHIWVKIKFKRSSKPEYYLIIKEN